MCWQSATYLPLVGNAVPAAVVEGDALVVVEQDDPLHVASLSHRYVGRRARRQPTSLLAAVALAGSPRGALPHAARRASPSPGKVVGIDPGHNGGNFSDPSFINSPVWNGREEEACDTTGTETDGGYTEALFNFRVASYLRARPDRRGRQGRDDAPHQHTASAPASPAARRS